MCFVLFFCWLKGSKQPLVLLHGVRCQVSVSARIGVLLPYSGYFLWDKIFHKTTIYCITENFRGLNFCGSEFRKLFIDIHQAHSKLAIVYTRDFTMEIFVKLCSIMVRDALISSMRTSIANGSGLACVRPGALTEAG